MKSISIGERPKKGLDVLFHTNYVRRWYVVFVGKSETHVWLYNRFEDAFQFTHPDRTTVLTPCSDQVEAREETAQGSIRNRRVAAKIA